MAPSDPDELELAAARSPEPAPDDTAEVARTRRLGAAARALTPEDHALDDVPAGLWDRIAGAAPGSGRDASPLGRGPGETAGAERPDDPPAPVVPFDTAPASRRRSRWRAGLLGAAAAAIVVVVAAIAVNGGGGADDDGGVTVAQAELEPLPDAVPGTGAATASFVERDGGTELDLPLDVPAASGFYEVWLIDEAVEGMVSLGPVRADGRYQVPANIDIRAFPIVDVSVEPPDGDPTHSGVSVLRGTLA
jgi:hypothetical protein